MQEFISLTCLSFRLIKVCFSGLFLVKDLFCGVDGQNLKAEEESLTRRRADGVHLLTELPKYKRLPLKKITYSKLIR